MKSWFLLAGAIVLEVTGSLSLRSTIVHPAWYALVAVSYVGAFYLLVLMLRMRMPVGVVNGVWGASGVALTALLGAAMFGEKLSALMLCGIGLIIVGVLGIQIGSQRDAVLDAKPPPS